MTSSVKTLVTVLIFVLLAVGLVAGTSTVSAAGTNCGSVIAPREPLLASRAALAACEDRRSDRALIMWMSLGAAGVLGVWRLGQSRRGVRQAEDPPAAT